MKTALAFLFLALSPVLAAESADALVDRLITKPGDFDQMCDAPLPINPRLPLPIYKLIADRDMHFTSENREELRKRRAEVVPVLVKRLAAYDFAKPPKTAGQKPKNENDEVSGINPRQLSGLLYDMILTLDAVETLPQLLRLEEQLRSLLAKADQNSKVAVPVVYLDGYISMPRGKDELSKRDQAMSKGRIVQRELLSVMLQLLRAKKFQPLLDSDLEKTYAVALREAVAKHEDLKDIKTPADAKAKGLDWVTFDPIYNIPHAWIREHPAVPFTPEVRNTVRGLVEQYLKANG